MKIYIVNAGSREHIELMKNNGWGRMHLADQWRYPEQDLSWALDNGAFSCWKNNLPFNESKFKTALQKIQASISNPDFIVTPDIVAGGYDSLDFSLKWLDQIPAEYNCYLAVQDGMDPDYIADYVKLFEGLFVGGTVDWKLKTSPVWVRLAHDHNRKCHIGQIGRFRRLIWAKSIGADSIDSSTFAQAAPGTGFARIISALQQTDICEYTRKAVP